MKPVSMTLVVLLISAFACKVHLAQDPQAKTPLHAPSKLPGLEINFKQQYVDLEATICLDEGCLELVACAKGSKEHESIVAVSARPLHIHVALLLLGANKGHPAMRKQIGEVDKRWVNIAPRGDAIAVFLVTQNHAGASIERPIGDFIVRSNQRTDEIDGAVVTAPASSEARDDSETNRLPNTFVFAGSHLRDNGPGPRQYLADLSGNVISIATFGDELLCLPFHETREDNALTWRIKPKTLPKSNTKVTLRLRRGVKKAQKATRNTPPVDDSESHERTTGTHS